MNEDATSPVLSGPALEGLDDYTSVLDIFHVSVRRFAQKPAFSCMGRTLTYRELDRLSANFAAWLQHKTDLQPGERIAIQLPNVLQFPVAVFGALRAGLVLVNTNPLYTEREMEHQFKDSGARAIVILANMADKLERVIERTDIRHVLVTELGDLHNFSRRALINTVVKHVKKMVPRYSLPDAVGFRRALEAGRLSQPREATCRQNDMAMLQYTGGTTGPARGVMLTHGNLVANMLQTRAVIADVFGEGCETVVAPLPLYHIYTFTVNCLLMMETGNHTVLISNPRDLDGFIKDLGKLRFSGFIGLNTLFNALCNHEGFRALDFSALKLSIAGGMALTRPVAKRWEAITGCPIAEGYGMTETSPVVAFNPPGAIRLGTIGRLVPGTSVKVIDAEGHPLPFGETGELCVKGPQVMQGYWNRREDTANALHEGWIRTGDIAVIEENGYLRIVDRKKDMIIVSGFNVYPNEIEDVVAGHPDIIEAAAIGIPDEDNGEVVKLFVISRNPELDAGTLRQWCRQQLTAYKVPRQIEFCAELPKSSVGKILRRELRGR